MRQPDISLTPPRFQQDPSATRDMASYTAKLEDMIRDLYSKVGTAQIRTSAPTVKEINEEGDATGNTRSDIIILDDATQTNRKLYYIKNGTLRLIDSA